MNKNASKPANPFVEMFKSFWAILVLGLRVLFSEIRWMFLKALRVFEQAQLRRRLKQEYALLGQAVAEQLQGLGPEDILPKPTEATILAVKQIAFLQEEIHHLEKERDRLRKEFVEKRRQRLGIEDDTDI